MLGLLQILGGLALFLYGIRMLSIGMEQLTGEQIQKWLDRVVGGRLKSAAFGAVATALIQSSGLLMVTMIGLINANLLTVQQAIGVMLGQEIGTTLTAQIVAFEIGDYRLILVVIGIIFLEFLPNPDTKKYGEIVFGLGIIFIGMSFMAHALDELILIPWVCNLLVEMGQHPWMGVLVGIVITGITQSSTAITSLAAPGVAQPLTDPHTLFLAVKRGILDAPQLRNNPFGRGLVSTRIIAGACLAAGSDGSPLAERERLAQLNWKKEL